MSGRRKRRSGSRGESSERRDRRFLRMRLPDGSLGRAVPVVFYPRFTTMIGGPSAMLLDLSRFDVAKLQRTGRATFRVQVSEDSDRGWDERPIERSPERKHGRGRPAGARRRKGS